MNRKPEHAWELYLKMETSADSFSLLQVMANECYKVSSVCAHGWVLTLRVATLLLLLATLLLLLATPLLLLATLLSADGAVLLCCQSL